MYSEFEVYLARERAKNTVEHANVSFLSEATLAVLTVVLLWTMFPAKHLLLWLLASTAVSLIAFLINRKTKVDCPEFSAKKWQIVTVFLALSVGFLWGLIPALFFAPDNILYLALIVAMYTGYVSGALAVSFSHQLSFIGFMLGITLPFASRMFYEGGSIYTTIGGLSIFYVAMLTYVSRSMNKLFINSSKIQFDNVQLISALAKEKEAVELAVASKDRFLAAASHDLRQPLNAIGLFTDALRPLQTQDLGNEIVGKISASLKGLNGMLHSLLDISRLDADAVDNNPKHLCLVTLVAQLCEEYQEKAPELNIICDIDSQTYVFVDPMILHRIVRNILDNAVKYTHKGIVKISADIHDSKTRLIITDTGIGISADKLSIVFDEFEQLNNPERNREKGLGLGLAIVKRLCAIAAIKMQLDSKLGHGTIVTLTMLKGIMSDHPSSQNEAPASFMNKLVIVIDDEQDILVGMQHLLSSWGCNVQVADSLQQAISRLAAQSASPDLIISDLRLKAGENGGDAINAICEEYNKEIPALLVTGDTSPEQIKSIRERGFNILYKPVEPSELKSKLSVLLC